MIKRLLYTIIIICCGCSNAEEADISYMQDAFMDTLVGVDENGQSSLSWDEHAYDIPVHTVPLNRKNGIRYIKASINGVMMNFIFDTGASYILISKTEANYLYKQGQLSPNDYISPCILNDASNNTIVAHKVLINKVTIGTKDCYNVEACIAESLDAPLLLGMSALEKFAKVSIDNEKDLLILE